MLRLLVTGVFCLFSFNLLAHGSEEHILIQGQHDWIRGKTNNKSEGCCGFNDCHKIERKLIRSTREGYEVVFWGQTYSIPYSETQKSEDRDGNFFLCLRPDFTRRCFFAPPMSF